MTRDKERNAHIEIISDPKDLHILKIKRIRFRDRQTMKDRDTDRLYLLY